MKKLWDKINPFIWPTLTGPKPKDPPPIELSQIVIDDEHLDEAIKWQEKIYASEEDRRKGTESKAALFLSTISIASSLVLASATLVNSNKQDLWTYRLMIIISSIVCLYAARTVYFAVKTLQRRSYDELSFDDINIAGKEKKWNKALLKNIANNTRSNQNTINAKVDNLAMAQDYYLLALSWLCIYAFMLLVVTFFTKPVTKTDPLQTEVIIKSSPSSDENNRDVEICNIAYKPTGQLESAFAFDSVTEIPADARTVILKLGAMTAPNYPGSNKLADSALHIASVLLSSPDFKAVMSKLDFTCRNYKWYCADNRKKCSDRFSGTIVLDSTFRENDVTLDLFLQDCDNEFGHSSKNVKKNLFLSAGCFFDEKKLSPAYCYAYHIAHEYMHTIGFFHTDYKDDVAEQVGWIDWEILKRWRTAGTNVMELQPGQAFCIGLPGWINCSVIFCFVHHCSSLWLINSGPLSVRMFEGFPRWLIIRSSTLITRSDGNDVSTSMASDSRLKSSITFNSRKLLPSSKRSVINQYSTSDWALWMPAMAV